MIPPVYFYYFWNEKEKMMKELIFLETELKKMIWGEEQWVISANEKGDCKVRNEQWKGKTLSELWEEKPALFGNLKKEYFPLLIKVIQAKEDLSIQVHPDDAYAEENEEGSPGKNECWYILDCEKDAFLIIGHNAESKQELQEMIENGRWESLFKKVPVQKGDFIKIDAGTLHAIKGGITLLEIQENSDLTYRVYDYGRLKNGKSRELHTEKALAVIKVPAESIEESVYRAGDIQKNQEELLGENEYYKVFRVCVSGNFEMEQTFPFMIVSVIQGAGMLNDRKIKKGEHFIVPFDYGNMYFSGDMELICSTYPIRSKIKS